MTHAAPQPPPTTRILVVEDDLDTREFYAVLLADEGYHVLAAGTGQEALARVAVHAVKGSSWIGAYPILMASSSAACSASGWGRPCPSSLLPPTATQRSKPRRARRG